MGNLKKCSYHRSYTLWKKDLNGLNFNSQSLRKWICQDGEKKVVYWCMPLFLPFIFFLSLVFLCVFFFSILSFLSTFPLVPFTVHTTPFLYHLPLWNLPFLPFNCFWLLMGILPRLPTSLLATYPLTLIKVSCATLHSQTKLLACFLPLSIFTSPIWIKIKLPHHIPLWHASSGLSPYLPLLGEMSSQ